MKFSDRKNLRAKMPWLKRTRPPLVFFIQLALSLSLLAVMTLAFYRARKSASEDVSAAPRIPSQAVSQVALVQLPEFVEKVAMQSLRTFLSTFHYGSTNDIDFANFDEELPPLEFSEPVMEYKGNVEVELPKPKIAETRIVAPFQVKGYAPRPFPPEATGVFAFCDETLKGSGFEFEPPSRERYTVASGKAEFFVEVTDESTPHIFVLSSPISPDTRMIEGALLKARASRPCSGRVVVTWN